MPNLGLNTTGGGKYHAKSHSSLLVQKMKSNDSVNAHTGMNRVANINLIQKNQAWKRYEN